MLADVFGPAVVVAFLAVLVGLGLPLWAVIDAASRPTAAFTPARSSKGMWIALIAVFWFLTGIVGLVLAVVYLAAIRPRLAAVMR